MTTRFYFNEAYKIALAAMKSRPIETLPNLVAHDILIGCSYMTTDKTYRFIFASGDQFSASSVVAEVSEDEILTGGDDFTNRNTFIEEKILRKDGAA